MRIKRFLSVYRLIFQLFAVNLFYRSSHMAGTVLPGFLRSFRRTFFDRCCCASVCVRRLAGIAAGASRSSLRFVMRRTRRIWAQVKWSTFNRLLAYERALERLLDFIMGHRRVLTLSTVACVCILLGGTAFNASATYYEYSVGGQVLGVVKDEAAVESTLGRVGSPDPADKEKIVIDTGSGEKVVINKSEDITIEKKLIVTAASIQIDTEEQIVQKISDLDNISVVAYTFNVNGRDYGTLESIDACQAVLDRAQEYLLYGKNPSKFKEITWSDEINFNQTEIKKNELSDSDTVFERLITPPAIETADAGVTPAVIESNEVSIAAMDVSDLRSLPVSDAGLPASPVAIDVSATAVNTYDAGASSDNTSNTADNPSANNQDKNKAGADKISPALNLRTVQEIEYDETYTAKPEYNDSDKLYEGQEIVQSKGEPGKRHVIADLIRNNGKLVDKQITSEGAWAPSTPAKIMRGTKKMTDEVGKGWLIMPTSGPITSDFAYRWGSFHDGIDIGVRYGPVYAADAGRVVYAGNKGDGFGIKILIDHGNGRQTLYGHLSKLDVKVGQLVYQGQHIATSGSTGFVTGPHLHFSVYINGVPYNPMNYF